MPCGSRATSCARIRPPTQSPRPATRCRRGPSRPDLDEQDFGAWQGLTWNEVATERGGLAHKYWVAPAHVTPPEGESFVDVIERVTAAVTRRTTQHAGSDVVAVAHGGSIRAALALALGLDPERALAFSIDNLSITRIDHVEGPARGGAWRVAAVNLPAV